MTLNMKPEAGMEPTLVESAATAGSKLNIPNERSTAAAAAVAFLSKLSSFGTNAGRTALFELKLNECAGAITKESMSANSVDDITQ